MYKTKAKLSRTIRDGYVRYFVIYDLSDLTLIQDISLLINLVLASSAFVMKSGIVDSKW